MILNKQFESVLYELLCSRDVSHIYNARMFLETKATCPRFCEWVEENTVLDEDEWKVLILTIVQVLTKDVGQLPAVRKAPARKFKSCAVAECFHLEIECQMPIESDHIWPLSLGGPDFEWNMQGLCMNHNRIKGNSFYMESFQNSNFLADLKSYLRSYQRLRLLRK